MHPIQQMILEYHSGRKRGIYSCCCANEIVIRAALKQALNSEQYVLIEATANQVNQNGGYTGMTPDDFMRYVCAIADSVGFPKERLILGGDHLGPLTWADLPEQEAMANACELVRSYVAAGFTKIHIDTSMKLLGDNPSIRLSDETIARRGALLCEVAEEGYRNYRKEHPEAQPPVYVVGSEVPIPGGTQTDETMVITSPADCENTIAAFSRAFAARGLQDAWTRVVGLVVQPGVEFGSSSVTDYDREKARPLCAVLKAHPQICFEAHSTDYQTQEHLRQMVEDGYLILKVGPALTFALREALLALDSVEQELYPGTASHYRAVLEQIMAEAPEKWEKYYHGTPAKQRLACIYSLSDRQRYYSGNELLKNAYNVMMEHLGKAPIPAVLLSQYLPIQYTKIRRGCLENNVGEILCDYVIDRCISDYVAAVDPA